MSGAVDSLQAIDNAVGEHPTAGDRLTFDPKALEEEQVCGGGVVNII
jgi:hypothetical protein